MSRADQFRQYAEEDVRWARRSTIDKEKKALLELAHYWMLAALQSESPVVVNDSPPESRKPASVGGLVRRAAWTRRHF